MILKVRNKTANTIVSLGLAANDTLIIFYNRPFYQKEQAIWTAYYADQIEFLDDSGNVVCDKQHPNTQLSDNLALFNSRWSSDQDDLEDLAVIVCNQLVQIIRGMFRRANTPNYGKLDMLTAMGSISTLLAWGDYQKAGNLIVNIPTDAFFTVPRKNKLKSYIDAISF